jgi:protein-S-isoprenylcysteine O-methyltransferase Ste14
MSKLSQRMNRLSVAVHAVLHPAFAALLAISQFTSRRGAIFTPNAVMLILGGLITIAGVWLWAAAARHLTRAVAATTLATTGPYRTIRHPIYASMYLICIGMGLIFFAWLWFVVLLAFAPLWWLEARREEVAIAATYGEAYATHQSQTSMFVPGIW